MFRYIQLLPLVAFIAYPHWMFYVLLPISFVVGFSSMQFSRMWAFLRIVFLTAPRDLKGLIRLLRTKFFISSLKRRNMTVAKVAHETAKKYPERIAFYYNDERWTFRKLDEFSNRVANALLEQGFHPGQEVALFMDSRPEFVGIWLGCSKAGLITAMINTHLRLDSLIHCITVVNCRAVIFSNELLNAVEEVMPTIRCKRPGIQLYCYGQFDPNQLSAKSLASLIYDSSSRVPSTMWQGNFDDRLSYIYTSGTTGLPKAAIIKNARYFWMGGALRNLVDFGGHQTIYTCLPFYHLSGCLGTCQCLVFGDTLAIRQKFSASRFWDDCIKYRCTAAQYIGEICRYLLSQEPKPTDQLHQVKLMFGNGLRPKIWRDFTERFNIDRIGEFYGSTEGNANVINVDNTEGSCGFISRIAGFIYPVALIRVDETTNEPVRDKHGLCVLVKGGECGEFVGKIIEDDPSRAFDGYVDNVASQKKMVQDVFTKGDRAFLSGDLLYMDDLGYLYFRDRTGDTFRWRGENVSTTEIEAAISNLNQLIDCVVFGVEVPNCEGRAGMVVMPTCNELNLDKLLEKMQRTLPSFAVPLFVRLVDSINATGTFKMTKTAYIREGYDPNLIKDPLFVLDPVQKKYIQLNNGVYKMILAGKMRF